MVKLIIVPKEALVTALYCNVHNILKVEKVRGKAMTNKLEVKL